MNKRLIVVHPSDADMTANGVKYFSNFIWRLRDAMTRDGLNDVDIRAALPTDRTVLDAAAKHG